MKRIFITLLITSIALTSRANLDSIPNTGLTERLPVTTSTDQKPFTEPSATISCIGSAKNSAECDSSITYNEIFYFKIKDWDNALNDATKLQLYVEDIPLPYYRCEGVNKDAQKIFFSVKLRSDITTAAGKTFIELVRRDLGETENHFPVSFGVGTRDGTLVLKPKTVTNFAFYNSAVSTLIFIAAIVFAILGFILLSKKKALNENPDDERKSLRKFQLVFWTLIIAFSYLSLWIILKDAPLLPERVLGLLSISLGTTVISSYIPAATTNDTNKRLLSKKGLNGLMMDGDGEFTITKMQYLLFTLIFGAIFIYTSLRELRIYDISAQQLILMGLSSAGYLGYKAYKAPNNPSEPLTNK